MVKLMVYDYLVVGSTKDLFQEQQGFCGPIDPVPQQPPSAVEGPFLGERGEGHGENRTKHLGWLMLVDGFNLFQRFQRAQKNASVTKLVNGRLPDLQETARIAQPREMERMKTTNEAG